MIPDFHSVFLADFGTGRLYWKAPPQNHAEKLGAEAGYINVGKGKNKSYWHIRAFGKTYKRSRVIFCMAHGRWPNPQVDHINGDSLDDRLENLRECTASQNAVNSPPWRHRRLPRGISITRQGKYMARLTVEGITRSLGTFDTVQLALDVYKSARKEAFGEYDV